MQKNFIEQQIETDLAAKHYPRLTTRFPPEPNGYLHIGHAKAICLNFGLAECYQGHCHLRMDDTNPSSERQEFAEAIAADIRWLGFRWDRLCHASDYFEQLFQLACQLIEGGLAYVCCLSMEETRQLRGTLTQGGQNSPYRERSIAENLRLFKEMRAGKFTPGSHVLRAKIDMQAANLNLRDPILYRILDSEHQRTGKTWKIYPTYDYAHALSDAIEGITHSLCTLEFQDHRPLYNWCIQTLCQAPWPQQMEFSRLQLTYTLTSKRNLKMLVEERLVQGWDDPRMPTLSGLRRRGIPAMALRNFCERLGISKSDSVIDYSVFEEEIRNYLNLHAARAMCVLEPLKITITNLPPQHLEYLTVPNHPQQPELGSRQVAFTNEIYIERTDFLEQAGSDFKRLTMLQEVRLRHAYVLKCQEVIKDAADQPIELRCTYDPATLGKKPEGRKVKGVIHWVSAQKNIAVTVRLYQHLFQDPHPWLAETPAALLAMLRANSLVTLTSCYLEAHYAALAPEIALQFERLGYFVTDRHDSKPTHLVFNRIVNLQDG
jgi:glutaminyl-tRNA synthetase